MVQKAKKSAAKTPAYLQLSYEEQVRMYQQHLPLINAISKSLRLKQSPSVPAAFHVLAPSHGIPFAIREVLVSLIGHVLSVRRRKFKSKSPKRESFYDFTGAVLRLKSIKEGAPRYQVQEASGVVIYFTRDRNNSPQFVSAERGNPSLHLIHAAAMFAYDRWIRNDIKREAAQEVEVAQKQNGADMFAEHERILRTYHGEGESPLDFMED